LLIIYLIDNYSVGRLKNKGFYLKTQQQQQQQQQQQIQLLVNYRQRIGDQTKRKMFALNCSVQKYAWGRVGSSAKVAIYKQAHDETFTINENEKYAELWMGTHANGPSRIRVGDGNNGGERLLKDYLKQRGEAAVGEGVGSCFYMSSSPLSIGDLPFLFKVLSINQALSVQAHPNKSLAYELNKRDPKNYPDSNHKPEMIVSISENFEAMCGFRPSKEIAINMKENEQLAALCGKENCARFIDATMQGDDVEKSKSLLRECFSMMMNRDEKFLGEQFDMLCKRLQEKSITTGDHHNEKLNKLFLRLAENFPRDVGCFSIYLLNYIELRKGEAIFLSANVPHAYLFGEGVECMSCSDNVVRAGLTPKYKDVKVLCEMLDYTMLSADENKLKSMAYQSTESSPLNYMRVFKPPIDEFSMQQIEIKRKHYLKESESGLLIPKCSTASIMIVIESVENAHFKEVTAINANGNSVKCHKCSIGLVYFIEPSTDIFFWTSTHSDESNNADTTLLLAYRAYIDIKS
jgi:mannose-6-phosphate isomerase